MAFGSVFVMTRDLHECARPELVILVVEARLELDRAGGRIDLVVDDFEDPARKRRRAVLIEREDRRFALSGGCLNRVRSD